MNSLLLNQEESIKQRLPIFIDSSLTFHNGNLDTLFILYNFIVSQFTMMSQKLLVFQKHFKTNVPSFLICPISKQPFQNPVICPISGETFDASSLVNLKFWPNLSSSNEPIDHSKLIPSMTIRQALDYYGLYCVPLTDSSVIQIKPIDDSLDDQNSITIKQNAELCYTKYTDLVQSFSSLPHIIQKIPTFVTIVQEHQKNDPIVIKKIIHDLLTSSFLDLDKKYQTESNFSQILDHLCGIVENNGQSMMNIDLVFNPLYPFDQSIRIVILMNGGIVYDQ